MTRIDNVYDFQAVKAAVGDLLGDYASSAYVGRHLHWSDDEISYYCYPCETLIEGPAVITEVVGHAWAADGSRCWAFVCEGCSDVGLSTMGSSSSTTSAQGSH